MFAEIKRLVKHSGIYGLGAIASKTVGFLMIPAYTYFLTPGDYGVLELLDLIVFFATSFAAMGIYGAVFRFYAAYETEKDKQEVIATAFLSTAIGSLVCATALIIWAPAVAKAVLGNAAFADLLRVTALTFFFSNLCEIPLAYWRAREQTTVYVAVTFARTLLGAGLLACSLVVLKWGVRGVVYANFLTSVVSGLTLASVVFRQVPRRLVMTKLAEMLRFGFPLVFSGLASFVLVFSDRIFLRQYGNLEDVGVYALGYKLAMAVTLLVSVPFGMTWAWQQFEVARKENARDMYTKIQLYQLLVTTFVGLAVAVLAKDFLRILTPPSYWHAARIVPLIVLCYILENVRSVILSGVYVQRVTHYLLPIAVVIAGTDLFLNYLLIPRYMAMGAAVATLLAYALNLVLCFWVQQRVYPLRYDYVRNGLVLGLAAVIYLASTLAKLQIAWSILMNLSLLSLFLALSSKLLDRDERNALGRLGLSIAQSLRGVRGPQE